MTTVQITGGAVEFTRPSNYSTDKSGAKVTLTFMCAEGTGHEEAVGMLDRVISLAVERAMGMVGDKATGGAQAGAGKALIELNEQPKGWSGPTVGQKVGEPAAERVDTLGGVADIIMGMGNGVAANPPGAVVADASTTAASTATIASPSDEVITDQQMVEAISSKNAHLLNAAEDDLARQQVPVALHALVAGYVPPPAKVQAIPVAKRAAFLAQLAAL